MKKEFIFIILHYNEKSLKDTFECVESIEKIADKENYQIIIVENGSQDRSKGELIKKYENNSKVNIIISEVNLGFAKGNNLGCKIGIQKFYPDYIIVLNNDTYIKQKNFLLKIKEIYQREKFDLLGPYIFDKNLKPQNPQLNLLTDLRKVEKKLVKLKRDLKVLKEHNKLYFFIQKIKKVIISNKKLEVIIRKILKREIEILNEGQINETIKNIGLHGSCIIFSKKYYTKYKEIFYSKTFMYIEEDILYHKVIKDNLISIYSPEIKIYHKEDSSTNAILQTNKEKEEFILKNKIDSLKIYRNMLIDERRGNL